MLYETGGWIHHHRISRKGDSIAFLDHPVQGDSIAGVSVVDLNGKKTALTEPYGGGAIGFAWSPNGDEIWFTAVRVRNETRTLRRNFGAEEEACRTRPRRSHLAGRARQAGRVLLARDNWRRGLIVRSEKDSEERDFTWLDWSYPVSLSADGKTLLFREEGEAGGPSYAVSLRRTDGSPAVRLGDGASLALSPDGKWALGSRGGNQTELFLLPTGAGEPKQLDGHGIIHTHAMWFPDSQRILFAGTAPNQGPRLYVQDIAGDKVDAISPPKESTISRSPCHRMADLRLRLVRTKRDICSQLHRASRNLSPDWKPERSPSVGVQMVIRSHLPWRRSAGQGLSARPRYGTSKPVASTDAS